MALILSLLLIFQVSASDLTITAPTVATCSNEGQACIEVKAESAEGSHIRPLWLMKNVKAKLVDRKLNREYQLDSNEATYDWDMNRIVIYGKDLSDYTEIRLSNIQDSIKTMRETQGRRN